MAKVGDEVVLRGTVTKVGCDTRLVVQGTRSWWFPTSVLTCVVPAPVTVECELGVKHLLTDVKTARARGEALGISFRGVISPDEFVRICAELAEKGVTAEQFREGLET